MNKWLAGLALLLSSSVLLAGDKYYNQGDNVVDFKFAYLSADSMEKPLKIITGGYARHIIPNFSLGANAELGFWVDDNYAVLMNLDAKYHFNNRSSSLVIPYVGARYIQFLSSDDDIDVNGYGMLAGLDIPLNNGAIIDLGFRRNQYKSGEQDVSESVSQFLVGFKVKF